VQELLHTHNQRLHVANDATSTIKWLSVLVLGALTQVALLLVHVGNRHAMRVSVGLFTIAFIFCLVIIAMFDDPFQIVLAGEPRASLATALKGL